MAPPKTDRPFPKRHRLAKEVYADPAATFHMVARAFPQSNPFTPGLGNVVWQTLLIERQEGRAHVWAGCLMPDHLHLLISPGTIPATRWMSGFKSVTARLAWEIGCEGALWQPSFWDGLIRTRRELESTVAYIWNNPVEAGLVEDPLDWPWLGDWTEN